MSNRPGDASPHRAPYSPARSDPMHARLSFLTKLDQQSKLNPGTVSMDFTVPDHVLETDLFKPIGFNQPGAI